MAEAHRYLVEYPVAMAGFIKGLSKMESAVKDLSDLFEKYPWLNDEVGDEISTSLVEMGPTISQIREDILEPLGPEPLRNILMFIDFDC